MVSIYRVLLSFFLMVICFICLHIEFGFKQDILNTCLLLHVHFVYVGESFN